MSIKSIGTAHTQIAEMMDETKEILLSDPKASFCGVMVLGDGEVAYVNSFVIDTPADFARILGSIELLKIRTLRHVNLLEEE